MIRLTDSAGTPVVPFVEPPHGSILLTYGETGTAWQRFFNDGLWHSVTGDKRKFKDLPKRNLFLVYEAPEEG